MPDPVTQKFEEGASVQSPPALLPEEEELGQRYLLRAQELQSQKVEETAYEGQKFYRVLDTDAVEAAMLSDDALYDSKKKRYTQKGQRRLAALKTVKDAQDQGYRFVNTKDGRFTVLNSSGGIETIHTSPAVGMSERDRGISGIFNKDRASHKAVSGIVGTASANNYYKPDPKYTAAMQVKENNAAIDDELGRVRQQMIDLTELVNARISGEGDKDTTSDVTQKKGVPKKGTGQKGSSKGGLTEGETALDITPEDVTSLTHNPYTPAEKIENVDLSDLAGTTSFYQKIIDSAGESGDWIELAGTATLAATWPKQVKGKAETGLIGLAGFFTMIGKALNRADAKDIGEEAFITANLMLNNWAGRTEKRKLQIAKSIASNATTKKALLSRLTSGIANAAKLTAKGDGKGLLKILKNKSAYKGTTILALALAVGEGMQLANKMGAEAEHGKDPWTLENINRILYTLLNLATVRRSYNRDQKAAKQVKAEAAKVPSGREGGIVYALHSSTVDSIKEKIKKFSKGGNVIPMFQDSGVTNYWETGYNFANPGQTTSSTYGTPKSITPNQSLFNTSGDNWGANYWNSRNNFGVDFTGKPISSNKVSDYWGNRSGFSDNFGVTLGSYPGLKRPTPKPVAGEKVDNYTDIEGPNFFTATGAFQGALPYGAITDSIGNWLSYKNRVKATAYQPGTAPRYTAPLVFAAKSMPFEVSQGLRNQVTASAYDARGLSSDPIANQINNRRVNASSRGALNKIRMDEANYNLGQIQRQEDQEIAGRTELRLHSERLTAFKNTELDKRLRWLNENARMESLAKQGFIDNQFGIFKDIFDQNKLQASAIANAEYAQNVGDIQMLRQAYMIEHKRSLGVVTPAMKRIQAQLDEAYRKLPIYERFRQAGPNIGWRSAFKDKGPTEDDVSDETADIIT